MERFRDDRWRRVGASEEEIAVLAGEWDLMSPGAQEVEGTGIDSISDGMLAVVLEQRREADPQLVAGSIAEVLDQVGTDPAKARLAITAEEATAKPRSTLIAKLEEIAAVPATPPGQTPGGAPAVSEPSTVATEATPAAPEAPTPA